MAKVVARAVPVCMLLAALPVLICVPSTLAPCQPSAQSSTVGMTTAESDIFLKNQLKGLANNPAGLSFRIRLKDNKDQFQQGEIIRVELSFSSSLPKTYQLDGALYDRGGRLGIDTYCIDPAEGPADPLKDHWMGGIGGGIRSMPILEEKPHLIVRDLNEYLRFDKPGKFRLYVVSNRVEREPTEKERADKNREGLVLVPATSNIIELNVVSADPVWARQQLESATRLLDQGDKLRLSRFDDGIRSATRLIRFLGTEDAARYMVRHFEDSPGEFSFGLMGSPLRSTVVEEMEAGLASPDCVIPSSYLWVLTSCSFLERSSYHAAPYPGTQDSAKLKLWQEEESKAQLARTALRESYVRRLAAALPKKEGRAKAVSIDTILGEIDSGPKERRPAEYAGLMEGLRPELVRIFFDLPAQTQRSLLEYRWKWIKGPAVMPVLERYYENPSQEKDVIDPTAAGVALRRIYELDPARGRELILREIAHPTGRVRFEVLSILPDKTLPEMDQVFVSVLEKVGSGSHEEVSLQIRLLARYGTSAILAPVKQAWTALNGDWCAVQAPVIAYFLRTDPVYGAEELERAFSPEARPRSGCHLGVLREVAQLYSCPEMEKVAIRHLDDPDPNVVLDAVETLGKHGSAAAETPLWQRFQRWHDESKEQAEEMRVRRLEHRPELERSYRMQSAFRVALAMAQGWLADEEKLTRIKMLCLTDQERQQVDYMISEAQAPRKRLSFMPGPGDSWTIAVAQYENLPTLDAVKVKLAQFPKGTVFLWAPYNAGQNEAEKKAVLGEIRTYLAQLGMSIEEQPQHQVE